MFDRLKIKIFSRAKIKLEGVVQGVGFRPFVHRLANQWRLKGFVINTSNGIKIEVEGEKEKIINFYNSLLRELPPLARITKKEIVIVSPKGYKNFVIRESKKTSLQSVLVSPDIGICQACYQELFSYFDRRYLYPFINCTNCGPRFSIIQNLPYDRKFTTMRRFKMCPKCEKEYRDIFNRRYHTQLNACSFCGPKIKLLKIEKNNLKKLAQNNQAIIETIKFLKQGKIIAIKGIGGFHLACDAYNLKALNKLRQLKNRPFKPFALMIKDIEEIKKISYLSSLEEKILIKSERPIVLLKKKQNSKIFQTITPDNNYLGIILPYTPLHYLLFSKDLSQDKPLKSLIMTSGNIAEESIEKDNFQAIKNLSTISDYFLLHNRNIYNRVDDSLVQIIDNKVVILRRGRGYSPFPFFLNKKMKEILGCGGELKNTFCLTKNRFAFLSQYIGDLKTYSTFNFYRETIKRFLKLFAIKPKIIACDLHPDYLSTQYAQELKSKNPSLKIITVQHHEAHIASVIAEHQIKQKVIGVCFDGLGYGRDKKSWGGEFFIGNLKNFQRVGHLEYIEMPGGDKVVQEPYRMAISYLYKTFQKELFKLKIPFIKKHKLQLKNIIYALKFNSILTSSIGRLFDAVSALLGICDIITYEAQAAIRLQMLAEKSETDKRYNFTFYEVNNNFIINPQEVIKEIIFDIQKKTSSQEIARKFHNGLIIITTKICSLLKNKYKIDIVCLSGGVFQNKFFLEKLIKTLRKKRFKVYYNELLPTNDGAISLGQTIIVNEICV